MIPALKIRNFRLFKELDIENLKRVNLFAGRNNTGKTALLEALRIFGEADNVSVLRYSLEQRGEFKFEPWNFYDSVYYRPELERLKQDSQNPLVLSINHYELTRKFISERNVNYTLANTNSPNSEPLNAGNLFFQQQQPLFPNDRFVFVPFNAKEYFPLNYYWDKIALTPLEDDLINILKETILPNLVRLDVQQNERVVVRLKEESKPIPLKNLGDGAQRMFLMALALINAKDSVLLIDVHRIARQVIVVSLQKQVTF
jgi:AAA15 family ATPase/GTPase